MEDIEDDEYFNSSNKGFSFNDDDEDDNDYVDGEQISFPHRIDRKLIFDDTISEISYELPPLNDIPLHLLISDNDLRIVLEEQSLEETPLPKGITIEDELKLLRRKMKERVHSPPPSIVINQILWKKPYTLECFKSLNEKEELLDAAIESGNGDAILAVTLFLVKTLKRKYVVELLDSRPEAVQHYMNYLLTRLQISECTEWLTSLGKHNELAMLQFRVIMKMFSSNPQIKKDKLQKMYNEYFTKPGVNSFHSQIVINYINLLDLQLKESASTHSSSSIKCVDSSVLKTLYLACSKHKWNTADIGGGGGGITSPITRSEPSALNLWHPNKLMEMYRINQSQFEWIALNERARTQAWRDLEELFEKKKWHNLKSRSFTIHLPLDRVILKLYEYSAPVAVLNHFLGKISDVQNRLVLAKKCNAIKSVVDSLVELKDKSEMEKLIEQLTNGTDVRFYAENALKSLNSKWKAENLKIIR